MQVGCFWLDVQYFYQSPSNDIGAHLRLFIVQFSPLCLLNPPHSGGITTLEAKARTGVFVGISSLDFQCEVARCENARPSHTTGTSHAVSSGRISYTFGFGGPCMSIDTACSSSLVALDTAMKALRSNECDYAIVAGVNGIFSSDMTSKYYKLGMLAPDGRCKTFDASANGYVRAEGGCCIVLRACASDVKASCEDEASAAEDDGLAEHTVHAYVCGTAVQQDGKSASLTSPRGGAQEDVIR